METSGRLARGRSVASEPAALAGQRGEVALEVYLGFMSKFCTGVTIVTATDRHGQPHGMTCTSMTSVTLAPPTLLVCLNAQSRTLGAVQDSGSFGVNLLHSRGRRAAELFASRVPNRFDQVVWKRAERIDQLWLSEDAFAMAECSVTGIVPVGDHMVVFGLVINVVQTVETPLIYGMRTFSSWPAGLSERGDDGAHMFPEGC